MRKYFVAGIVRFLCFCVIFQILTEKNINKADIAQGYFSLLLLIIVLMNTFLYCGAGELVAEQVSYNNIVYK